MVSRHEKFGIKLFLTLAILAAFYGLYWMLGPTMAQYIANALAAQVADFLVSGLVAFSLLLAAYKAVGTYKR